MPVAPQKCDTNDDTDLCQMGSTCTASANGENLCDCPDGQQWYYERCVPEIACKLS